GHEHEVGALRRWIAAVGRAGGLVRAERVAAGDRQVHAIRGPYRLAARGQRGAHAALGGIAAAAGLAARLAAQRVAPVVTAPARARAVGAGAPRAVGAGAPRAVAVALGLPVAAVAHGPGGVGRRGEPGQAVVAAR